MKREPQIPYVNRYKLYPERYKANQQVNYEIRMGRLIRPENCSICGIKAKIHAHHEDYSKPLDVKWLCQKCHIKIHRGFNINTGAEKVIFTIEEKDKIRDSFRGINLFKLTHEELSQLIDKQKEAGYSIRGLEDLLKLGRNKLHNALKRRYFSAHLRRELSWALFALINGKDREPEK